MFTELGSVATVTAHTAAMPLKEPFTILFNKSADLLPNIVWALLLLFCGLFLSRGVSVGVKKILNAVKLDVWTSKIGLNEILTRIGFGKSPTYVAAFVLSWTVMICFIVMATDALGLGSIHTFLSNLLAFVPKLFAGIIILFAGLLFGRFVGNVVASSARANNIKGGVFLSKITNVIVVVLTILLAFEQVSINLELINKLIIIIAASLGLAFAIAFGLGAKDAVAQYIKENLQDDDKK
jgi:hypothetical protein